MKGLKRALKTFELQGRVTFEKQDDFVVTVKAKSQGEAVKIAKNLLLDANDIMYDYEGEEIIASVGPGIGSGQGYESFTDMATPDRVEIVRLYKNNKKVKPKKHIGSY